MLHIILLILKIIGIVLLCILGVLILAILGALFVPVRYRIKLVREEGEDKPPFTAYVKITWLLHLVNIFIQYPADVIVRVRLMFFTLFKLPHEEKTDLKQAGKEAETGKRKQNQPKEQNEDKLQSDIDTSIPQKNISENRMDDYVAFESDFTRTDDSTDYEQQAEPSETEAGSHSKEKFSLTGKFKEVIDKIKQIVEKIKTFFKNIQYTIRKFCDKIKSTLNNIEYYRKVFESESFKQSFRLCQRELKSVFKSVKPDRFEAAITFGMDDPATTGEILAIYGILYPLIGQNIQVVGDFEWAHIEGNMYIRGKIRAFTFIKAAIKVYFSKDIKKLIKLLKKKEAV